MGRIRSGADYVASTRVWPVSKRLHLRGLEYEPPRGSMGRRDHRRRQPPSIAIGVPGPHAMSKCSTSIDPTAGIDSVEKNLLPAQPVKKIYNVGVDDLCATHARPSAMALASTVRPSRSFACSGLDFCPIAHTSCLRPTANAETKAEPQRPCLAAGGR